MTSEVYGSYSASSEEPQFVNADLHNHLATSSRMKEGWFNEVANVTRRRLGSHGIIGVVNFGDHRYEDLVSQKGYERQDIGNAVYVPSRNILIVKGQEVPTQQGHLLVLGIPSGKHLVSGKVLEDTIKEARDLNGIVVADHPFYHQGIGPYLARNPKLIRELDAIEVFNGEASLGIPPLPKRANSKAHSLWIMANDCHIGAISTSDGHSLYEIGRSYTPVERPSFSTAEKLSTSLRRSVQNATSDNRRINTLTGFVGAIDHCVDLAFLIAEGKTRKLLGKN